VAFGLHEFARSEFARRTRIPFTTGCDAFAASPEDVIVAKPLYFKVGRSEKHTRDIASMLRISGGRMDLAYLEHGVQRLGLDDGWSVATRLAESSD
jgi:hypothetical protein